MNTIYTTSGIKAFSKYKKPVYVHVSQIHSRQPFHYALNIITVKQKRIFWKTLMKYTRELIWAYRRLISISWMNYL